MLLDVAGNQRTGDSFQSQHPHLQVQTHNGPYRWMDMEDSRPVHLHGGLQWQVELASDDLYLMCLWVDDSLSV